MLSLTVTPPGPRAADLTDGSITGSPGVPRSAREDGGRDGGGGRSNIHAAAPPPPTVARCRRTHRRLLRLLLVPSSPSPRLGSSSISHPPMRHCVEIGSEQEFSAAAIRPSAADTCRAQAETASNELAVELASIRAGPRPGPSPGTAHATPRAPRAPRINMLRLGALYEAMHNLTWSAWDDGFAQSSSGRQLRSGSGPPPRARARASRFVGPKRFHCQVEKTGLHHRFSAEGEGEQVIWHRLSGERA